MKFYRFLAESALSPSTSLRTCNSEVVEMTSCGSKQGFLPEPALSPSTSLRTGNSEVVEMTTNTPVISNECERSKSPVF